MATDAKQEMEEVGMLCAPPSVGAVARHLPVLVDEDFVPVIPDGATTHDPEGFAVEYINWQCLQRRKGFRF
jgi:hypothetical protein